MGLVHGLEWTGGLGVVGLEMEGGDFMKRRVILRSNLTRGSPDGRLRSVGDESRWRAAIGGEAHGRGLPESSPAAAMVAGAIEGELAGDQRRSARPGEVEPACGGRRSGRARRPKVGCGNDVGASVRTHIEQGVWRMGHMRRGALVAATVAAGRKGAGGGRRWEKCDGGRYCMAREQLVEFTASAWCAGRLVVGWAVHQEGDAWRLCRIARRR